MVKFSISKKFRLIITPLAKNREPSNGDIVNDPKWRMEGLGKPKLCTKFEIPSFSHSVNIKVEPQYFRELPLPKATPTFSYSCDFMMDFGKPKLYTNLKSLASLKRLCKYWRGTPKVWGARLAQGHAHPFVCVVGIRKLECFCYLTVKTAWSYLHSSE